MKKPLPPRPSSTPPRGLAGDEPLDVDGVEKRLKKRAVNKLTRLVDEHPDEAVGALRRWLRDDG